MTRVSVAELLTAPLILEDSTGREWVFPQPSKTHGARIQTLYMVFRAQAKRQGGHCLECGQELPTDLPPRVQALYDAMRDEEFEEVILGPDLYKGMNDAGLSGEEIYYFARYVMHYVANGEDTAELVLQTYIDSKRALKGDDLDPKD